MLTFQKTHSNGYKKSTIKTTLLSAHSPKTPTHNNNTDKSSNFNNPKRSICVRIVQQFEKSRQYALWFQGGERNPDKKRTKNRSLSVVKVFARKMGRSEVRHTQLPAVVLRN